MIKQIIMQTIIMLIFGALVVHETVNRTMQGVNKAITTTCLNNGAMVINGVTFKCEPIGKESNK